LYAGPFDEYKAEYGQTLVCGYGRLGGVAVGIVANQRKRCKPESGPLQYGGVIYVDSADKAARFIMDCNQTRLPLIFLQDVNGFMVDAIRSTRGSSARVPSWSTSSPTAWCPSLQSFSVVPLEPATMPFAARPSTRGSSLPGRQPAMP